MEQPSTEKRKKIRQIKNSVAKATDSSYGSMKAGTSSNSSLSLSFFSESDLAPSTSGCSSEMANLTQIKERKKERAKEFMKKLKSLLPMKERMGKMDTLATLEQVVNSMRQLNEDQRRDQEFKMPAPYLGSSYQTVVADKISQSDMYIVVSPKNHVVHSASSILMTHLGYPSDWWKGRLLKDFLNKKDTNTVNSCLALHSTFEDTTGQPETSAVASISSGGGKESKYFYARIRRFRKLTEGFNLQNVVSYCPCGMTISTSKLSADTESDQESDKLRKSLTIYCQPLTSTFSDGKPGTEETKFSMRHSPCFKFTYVHPNAVRLLGFLPQDYTDMSVFELYHPEDLPQLLDIHKKIMVSMGQPFKSKSIRLRTRNGCYVKVDTEWSSFVNPWSMKLEFIICQHSVIKGPGRPDVFEDIALKTDKANTSPEAQKIKDTILNVLIKPIQDIFAEPIAPASTMEKAPTQKISSITVSTPAAVREGADNSVKPVTEAPKVHFQVQGEATSTDAKSTVIDDKGISSIYNQLNYSHNIKRFLMSHPKSFSNVSDEDSMMAGDDYDSTNVDEEMPLEIPVVKPPSCGSSTQVHVSEQGHGEDLLCPPTFGDDSVPTQELADNIHSLTEESLKKHTKIQERLYLQRISEEQPLLFNARKAKNSRGISHQKRPRPSGPEEEMESAKHPCTNGGIFRSSSNIFMQSFPTVTSTETPTHTNNNNGEVFCQSEMVSPQGAPIGIFPANYPTANQTGLQIPTQPITLMPGDSMGLSYIPTTLGTMVPGQSLVNVGPVRQPQNIQWPFYPQAGYTLLPQVMAGFYRPLLQPVQVQPIAPQQQGMYVPLGTPGTTALSHGKLGKVSPAANKGSKVAKAEKGQMDSDHPSSSVDDTTSSIMYLLEADSSAYEDSDTKGVHMIPHPVRVQKKRTLEPPWLRGVKWDADIKMRYQMPERNLSPTLKMDNRVMKKSQQNDQAQANLAQLLEEISLSSREDPLDEDADYLFFPGDEILDSEDAFMKDYYDEVDLTTSIFEDDSGGGYTEDDGGGGENMILWELDPIDQNDDNFDTPVNSQSEDENGLLTPTLADDHKEDSGTVENSEEENVGKDKTSHVDEDMPTVPTVYLPDQPHPETNIAKSVNGLKDGSLSGDDASGVGEELSTCGSGQKQETEDSQSNCSKVSSDLTPSLDRSNEDGGSSHKESDAPSKHLKSVPSTTTSNCSNEQSSPEESSCNSMIAQDFKEIFRKLFAPLKVQMSRKSDTPGMPYWLVQAHLSEKVAMTYKVPTRVLEDVLSDDRKRMHELAQSNTVKQQLLQLLSDVDQNSPNVSRTSSCPPPFISNSVQQATSMTSLTTSGTGSSMTVPAFSKSADQMSMASGSSSVPVMMSGIQTISEKKDRQDLNAHSFKLMSSNSEENTQLFQVRSSCSSRHVPNPGEMSDQACAREEFSPRTQDCQASDTNSDPMVGNSLTQSSASSSSQGQGSDATVHSKRPVRIPAAMPKTADMFFQDWCQAVASSVKGQTVEDIIMSKVFVSNDSMSTKTASNNYSFLE